MSCHSLGAYQEVHQSWIVRQEGEQSHHDFHVRRALVEHALTWLIENNIYYQANQVHINDGPVATR